MRKSLVLGLFALGLLTSGLAAQMVRSPGYMDAEYYYSGGVRLAQGYGLTEVILWNYLDAPQGLPHPSHTYWMPLASLLAAAGMKLGGIGFPAAQIPFILLAASLPLATAWLAYSLTGCNHHAWLAGLLAVFPGYYLPYLLTIETFGLYMLLGTMFLMLAFARRPAAWLRFLLLGVLAGLMHLSRADGLLWLLAVVALAVWEGYSNRREDPQWYWRSLNWFLFLGAGYTGVMSFWFARNLQAFHSLLPPGNSLALWITDYDQTFLYPAAQLTFTKWLAAGWETLLRIRLDAFVANFKTLLGVQGEIILLPLAAAGFWRLRKDRRILLALLLWLSTLAFMTLVFPFAGSRGGYLHSGSAFQSLIWAASAVGFDAFIEAGIRWRKWKPERATRGFGAILVMVVAVLTFALYFQRVVGPDPSQPVWQEGWRSSQKAEIFLKSKGAAPGSTILINNPPGYFAATGRPALVIPDGDQETMLRVARAYSVDFLILETNHVRGLNNLYQNPRSDASMSYLGRQGDTQFFKITNKP